MASDIPYREELSEGTVDELVKRPVGNYASLLVLRELKSHAIFTTTGEDADISTLSLNGVEYNPGLMFKRKQTGSDRRKGKEIQRRLLDIDCTMDVNEMCQKCVEDVLYGSAAAAEGLSITSRVMYDSGFSIRDSAAIIEEKFQSAPGDEYMEEQGRESGPREPDFYIPGTLFPTTITLRDATPEELAFVIAITMKNKRYGAVTSRIGRMKNHILGLYIGSEEGPANLELSQKIVLSLAEKVMTKDKDISIEDGIQEVLYSPSIDVSEVKELSREIYKDQVDSLSINEFDQEQLEEIIDWLKKDENLKEVLEDQHERSEKFVESLLSE